MQLWSKPIPRHVRFHDLRHTTATLLLKSGVPLATVQRVMRHTDPAVTTETYGHLEMSDMQTGVDQLRFDLPEQLFEEKVTRRGAPVVRKSKTGKMKGRDTLSNAKEIAAFQGSGRQDLNLRPLGPEPSALPG